MSSWRGIDQRGRMPHPCRPAQPRPESSVAGGGSFRERFDVSVRIRPSAAPRATTPHRGPRPNQPDHSAGTGTPPAAHQPVRSLELDGRRARGDLQRDDPRVCALGLPHDGQPELVSHQLPPVRL